MWAGAPLMAAVASPLSSRTYSQPVGFLVSEAYRDAEHHAGIRVTNRSGGANTITVSAAGTDQLNDGGSPGTTTVAQNANILLIAKLTAGGVAGSWMSF